MSHVTFLHGCSHFLNHQQQIERQIECQNICQKECQKMGQIECQKNGQKICIDRPDRMSDRIPERMSEEMSEPWQAGMTVFLWRWESLRITRRSMMWHQMKQDSATFSQRTGHVHAETLWIRDGPMGALLGPTSLALGCSHPSTFNRKHCLEGEKQHGLNSFIGVITPMYNIIGHSKIPTSEITEGTLSPSGNMSRTFWHLPASMPQPRKPKRTEVRESTMVRRRWASVPRGSWHRQSLALNPSIC